MKTGHESGIVMRTMSFSAEYLIKMNFFVLFTPLNNRIDTEENDTEVVGIIPSLFKRN